MRWDDFRRSDNVEDVRGGGGDDGGYGGGGMSMGGGGLGIGTIIVLGLLGWALGIDPRILIGGADVIMGGGSGPAIEQRAPTARPARPGRAAIRPVRPIHRRHPRQYRGCLGRGLQGEAADATKRRSCAYSRA